MGKGYWDAAEKAAGEAYGKKYAERYERREKLKIRALGLAFAAGAAYLAARTWGDVLYVYMWYGIGGTFVFIGLCTLVYIAVYMHKRRLRTRAMYRPALYTSSVHEHSPARTFMNERLD